MFILGTPCDQISLYDDNEILLLTITDESPYRQVKEELTCIKDEHAGQTYLTVYSKKMECNILQIGHHQFEIHNNYNLKIKMKKGVCV